MFGVNTTHDTFNIVSNFTRLRITISKISLVEFMPNITTNHAITYTNTVIEKKIKAWKTECEDRRVAG